MNSNRETDDPLTLLLRQGDPATDGEGLSAGEVARMRSALVTALEARGRPPRLRWRPVLATAAAAAFLLVLLLGRPTAEPPATDDSQEQPALVATAEKPAAILEAAAGPSAAPEAAASARPATHQPAVRRAASSGPTRRSQPRLSRVAMTPAAESEDVAAARTARQIEFETPGGTRVVWVLDPAYQALSTEVEGR